MSSMSTVSSAPKSHLIGLLGPLSVSTCPPCRSSIDIIDWKVCEDRSQYKYIEYIIEYLPASTLPSLSSSSSSVGAAPSPSSSSSVVAAKRFHDLYEFHQKLTKKFVCLPPFPPRTLTRSFDGVFVETRKKLLSKYLQAIIQRHDVMKSHAFHDFMSQDERSALIGGADEEFGVAAENHHGMSDWTHKKKKDNEKASAVSKSTIEYSVSRARVSSLNAENSQLKPYSPSDGDFDQDHEHEPRITQAAANSEEDAQNLSQSVKETDKSNSDSADNLLSSHSNKTDIKDETKDTFAVVVDSVEPTNTKDAQNPNSAKLLTDSENKQSQLHLQPQTKDHFDTINPIARKSSASAATATGLPATVSIWAYLPSRVSLVFSASVPVMACNRAILTSDNALLLCCADDSTFSKVDVFISSFFRKSQSTNTNPIATSDSLAGGYSASTSMYTADRNSLDDTSSNTAASSSDPSHPLGAVYVFRRQRAPQLLYDGTVDDDDDTTFERKLNVLFSRQITDARWDDKRRWLFLTTDDGNLHVQHFSHDFTSSSRIISFAVQSGAGISCCALSSRPNANYIFTATRSGTVSAFDVDLQSICSSFPYSQAKIAALEFDAEQQRLFVATFNREILIYDFKERKASTHHTEGKENDPTLSPSPALTPEPAPAPAPAPAHATLPSDPTQAGPASAVENANSHNLVTSEGSEEKSKAEDFEKKKDPSSDDLLADILRVSNSAAAAAADGFPTLAVAPRLCHSLEGHEGSVRALAFESSTNRLLSASFDRSVRVWSIAASGSELQSKCLSVLEGHQSRVKSVAFSTFGRYAASGDALGNIVLWDLEVGAAVLAWRAHDDDVLSLQFIGDEIVSGSADKTGKIWRVT